MRRRPLVVFVLGVMMTLPLYGGILDALGPDVETKARALQPALAFDLRSGSVYVAWSGRQGSHDYDIWLARGSLIGGEWVFSEPRRINDDSGSHGQWAPAMALLGPGHLFLVWEDERYAGTDSALGRGDVFGSEVEWDGESLTVGPNVRISRDGPLTLPLQPSATVTGEGVLYVSWSEEMGLERQIRFARGRVVNSTWLFEDVSLGTESPNCSQRMPSVLWDPGLDTLTVMWIEVCGGRERVLVFTMECGGTSSLERADSLDSSRKWGLTAIIDGQRMYIAWSDSRLGLREGGSGHVFFSLAERDRCGWNFVAEKPIGGLDSTLVGWQPSIGVSEGRPIIASTIGRIEDDFYGRSLNGTHLGIAVLPARVIHPNASSGSVSLLPPDSAWWSEPRIVGKGNSTFFLVWISAVGRETFLLGSEVTVTGDAVDTRLEVVISA